MTMQGICDISGRAIFITLMNSFCGGSTCGKSFDFLGPIVGHVDDLLHAITICRGETSNVAASTGFQNGTSVFLE